MIFVFNEIKYKITRSIPMTVKWGMLFIVIFFSSFTKSSLSNKEGVHWLSIEEVQVKLKIEKRPILVDLYTDWCYWCKVMDKKTYSDPKVAAYINEHYYAVKINAESKETIKWNEKLFSYNQQNKLNDFALFVSPGEIGFPTTVIFPEMTLQPAAIPGYMTVKDIEPVLNYFGLNKYNEQSYNDFAKTYKNKW
ncbi:MAG: DUF255 domain-containing protein [Ginsengibacter sp.]